MESGAEKTQFIDESPDLHLDSGCFLGPANVFCVTLYNEELPTLTTTLTSIILSLVKFHATTRDSDSFSTICIIADGVQKLAPGMLDAFHRWNLLNSRNVVDEEGTAIHVSLQDSSTLLNRIRGATRQSSVRQGTCLRIVLCLKGANMGKLHSHRLFFSKLCVRFSPLYCYQVDAGSILQADTIPLLVERMESDSEIGAIAPRVLPPVAAPTDSFLAHWQFFDFAFRASTSWPFEVATGHLSVLPGQVSLVRWRALQGNPKVVGIEGRTPLDVYLNGMDELSSTDRLRYLAEDRVIGISLMFAERLYWRLDYLPEAKGTTDRCESFDELLRQRRRWNNSSMATRIWLLQQLPAYTRRSDRTWRDKLAFVLAVGCQSILACREFFAPALLVALLVTLSDARQLVPASVTPLFSLYAAVICVELLIMLLSSFRLLRKPDLPSVRIGRTILHVVAPVLFLAIIFTFEWPAIVILLVPALSLLAAAAVGPPEGMWTNVRYQFSPIPAFTISSILSVYAFLRLNDVSWGTKGLTKANVASPVRVRLAQFRDKALACWLFANALLIFLSVQSGAANSWWSVNGVTLVACLTDGVLALIAVGFLYVRVRQRKALAPLQCQAKRSRASR